MKRISRRKRGICDRVERESRGGKGEKRRRRKKGRD